MKKTILTKSGKILSLIVLASLTLTGVSRAEDEGKAKAHQAEQEAHCVVITYRQPIHDYDVTILWRPRGLRMGYLIGPAIMEFKHKVHYKSFSLTNNYFGISNSDEWMKTTTIKEGYYVKTSQPHLVLDYAEPKMTDELPTTCFFFVDLNFDGKKEVVLTEIAHGQRHGNAYQVHEPDEIGLLKSHTITAKEPFASLDSGSKIDFKNRTIRLFLSGGAGNSEEKLYKFDESLGHYGLTEHIKHGE